MVFFILKKKRNMKTGSEISEVMHISKNLVLVFTILPDIYSMRDKIIIFIKASAKATEKLILLIKCTSKMPSLLVLNIVASSIDIENKIRPENRSFLSE